MATGLRDELPDIPGLAERWARDVLHCPYCHGWEVRDRRLGVLGGTPDAVRIVAGRVKQVIVEDDRLSGTALDDGRTSCPGVWVAGNVTSPRAVSV